MSCIKLRQQDLRRRAAVALGVLRQELRDAEKSLQLGHQTQHRRVLPPGVNVHDSGKQLRIFVDKHALPRHHHIVENQRGVDFVEARGQRLALGIGMFRVKIAADEFSSPCVFIGIANAIA